MYVEIEQHINDDGTEIETADDKMSLLLRKRNPTQRTADAYTISASC